MKVVLSRFGTMICNFMFYLLPGGFPRDTTLPTNQTYLFTLLKNLPLLENIQLLNNQRSLLPLHSANIFMVKAQIKL